MGLLSKLHNGTKLEHKETEEKRFVSRYKSTSLTLVDHYRHLCELLLIYQALEDIIKKNAVQIKLPIELNYLLQRSEEIKKDLLFLKPYLPFNFKDTSPLATTKRYIDELMKADGETIWAHYLVRILGDLFGGQKIKKYVANLFSRNNLPKESGLDFYNFKPDALKEFADWLNKLEFQDEEQIISTAKNAFLAHQQIFDELESTRIIKPTCPPFFSLKNVAIVAGTVLSTAILAYTHTNR